MVLYGVKAVCGQRHHILLAAGDEKHIAFVGELLEAEDVIIRFVPCIQETYGAEWTIHLDKCSHRVAKHCLSHCGTEGVGLLLIRDGIKTRPLHNISVVSAQIFPTRYSEHLGRVECLIYLPFLPL